MEDGSPAAKRKGSFTETLQKLFDRRKEKSMHEEFEEDILTMVNSGQEMGAIEDGEAKMISNIFALNDKEAEDIMTHRSQIVGVEASVSLEDAISFMLDENNSRFPVYEDNLDHIIGILHLKDACRMNRDPEKSSMKISQIEGLLREPVFVTETKKIDDIFRDMQKSKVQMVMVIDEYGQTAGLIAMEDILEEIVGNIMDEYDEEDTHIETRGNDRYVIDGMTPLENLEERFSISFHEEEYDTLNGFLISKLDRIPEENDKFSIVVDGYCFQILKVENRRIDKVLVYKVDEGES